MTVTSGSDRQPLTRLELYHVRNIIQAILIPHPRLNLIIGPNASGKTSLLEAAHLLGTGRSFRTARSDIIIAHGQTAMRITGTIGRPGRSATTIGLKQSQQGRELSIDSRADVRLAELASTLPLLMISPESHHDFLHSSRLRRGAIDWLLFHVEPGFFAHWSNYRRLLKQRNAALKARMGRGVIRAWDQEIAGVASAIDECRQRHLPAWQARLTDYATGFDYPGTVKLELTPGWRGESLAEALEQNLERDCLRGYTSVGPHRADLLLRIDDEDALDNASHGQQKLLITALRLAQLELFASLSERNCLLLLDDLPSELDNRFRSRLLALVQRLPAQAFITATDAALLNADDWREHQRFHVEQGVIQPQSS